MLSANKQQINIFLLVLVVAVRNNSAKLLPNQVLKLTSKEILLLSEVRFPSFFLVGCVAAVHIFYYSSGYDT